MENGCTSWNTLVFCMSCCVIPRIVTSCHDHVDVMPCHIMSCHVTPWHGMSCHFMSCHVRPGHVTLCHVPVMVCLLLFTSCDNFLIVLLHHVVRKLHCGVMSMWVYFGHRRCPGKSKRWRSLALTTNKRNKQKDRGGESSGIVGASERRKPANQSQPPIHTIFILTFLKVCGALRKFDTMKPVIVAFR